MGTTAATETSRVRVALVDCVGLLGDIIRRAVAAEPDFEVVADISTTGRTDPLLEVGADIVVWNNADETQLADRLEVVARGCGARVLATRADGRSAALWEVVPQRSPLASLSPSTIVELIRASAPHGVSS